MAIEIIRANDWPSLRSEIKPSPSLWHPFVPDHAITMIHGFGGVGKSGLLYGLGNAIQTGQPYLNLPTTKTNCLLISVDMNKFELHQRWGDEDIPKFIPKFDFAVVEPFDILDPRFRLTSTYTKIAEFIKEAGIGAVLIDALGGTIGAHSVNDDQTANGWYAAIKHWFPESAVIFLHHDRKARYNQKGEAIPETAQNSAGSGYWIHNCTSQIHMTKVGEHISAIKHDKCQVNLKHDEKIKLYIDINGQVEPWDQRRAENVQLKYWETARSLGVQDLPNAERDFHVAKFHNVSERTVRRWRSL